MSASPADTPRPGAPRAGADHPVRPDRSGGARADHDRARWPAAAAWGLAAAGVVAVLARPTAPPIGDVTTDLDRFAPAVLAAIADYRAPRLAAAVASLAIGVAVPVGAALTRRGRRAVARAARGRGGPVVRGALVGAGIAAVAAAARLPVTWWVAWRHEGGWGFRTAGIGQFTADVALGAGLAILAASGGGALVVALRRRWPRTWPWRLVVVGTGLAAVLALLLPVVVEPLVLRTRPLDDGPTRRAVAAVLDRAGEPDLAVVVGDASRRTTRVNAYVSGLGPSRRLVLFDNLLDLPPDEVAVVVAHELAHRQANDVGRGVLATAAALLPLALGLGALTRSGRWRRLADAGGGAGVVALALALTAVGQIATAPIATALSRRQEAAADHRALVLADAPAALIRVARTFVVRDLADPQPPAWTRALFATHPSPGERIRAAAAHAARTGTALPALAELRRDELARRHPRIGERPDR